MAREALFIMQGYGIAVWDHGLVKDLRSMSWKWSNAENRIKGMTEFFVNLMIWFQTSVFGGDLLRAMIAPCALSAMMCVFLIAGEQRRYQERMRAWRLANDQV